ncbi:MAG: potassium channel protein [Candidatus Omnitrophica bacterium]|nr:potassium channel protein [Candidatus Omnitrophota bacterium]
MDPTTKRLVLGAVACFGTFALAILGYWLAGWSFIDSVYMVIITIYGVGYGEVKPVDTPGLRLYTIVVIVVGTGAILYFIGGFVQMVMEGQINQALGARKKTKGIESLKDHAIICGYGRMGQILARELHATKHPFVIVDNNEERMAQAEAMGFLVVQGDAAEEESLKHAGVERATSLATVLPNDAVNVFITLTARNLNKDLTIYARGEIPSTEAKLLQAGANQVVLPATIGGHRLAHMIVRPAASDFLDQLPNISAVNDDLEQLGVQIHEIPIPKDSPFADRTIGDLEVEGEGAFLVVAVQRGNGALFRRPEPEFEIGSGDKVIVIGHGSALPRFTLTKTKAREIVWRGSKIQYKK